MGRRGLGGGDEEGGLGPPSLKGGGEGVRSPPHHPWCLDPFPYKPGEGRGGGSGWTQPLILKKSATVNEKGSVFFCEIPWGENGWRRMEEVARRVAMRVRRGIRSNCTARGTGCRRLRCRGQAVFGSLWEGFGQQTTPPSGVVYWKALINPGRFLGRF